MNLILLKNFIKNYLSNTKFYAIFLLNPLKKEDIELFLQLIGVKVFYYALEKKIKYLMHMQI